VVAGTDLYDVAVDNARSRREPMAYFLLTEHRCQLELVEVLQQHGNNMALFSLKGSTALFIKDHLCLLTFTYPYPAQGRENQAKVCVVIIKM